VLGVLARGPSTGYEIRKLLSETTAHFWKESFGQIYPTLESLEAGGMIHLVSETTEGRASKRYGILPAGQAELRAWLRRPDCVMKPGRNELLLKLFFARAEDASFLRPQVEGYRRTLADLHRAYHGFLRNDDAEEIPPDARTLIGTTIDYGIAAVDMQIAWCDRTIAVLERICEASG
jgi:DNA-binding PadR family transcriptional regulator